MAYTTTQGDTWDQIALKVYGSELSVRDIMAENGLKNPDLLLLWRFVSGVELTTPPLSASTSVLAELPPYRRT